MVLVRDRFAAVEVGSTPEDPPDVLLTPHHALGGAPGRTAGVDDVEVVTGPGTEAAFR